MMLMAQFHSSLEPKRKQMMLAVQQRMIPEEEHMMQVMTMVPLRSFLVKMDAVARVAKWTSSLFEDSLILK